MNDEKTATQAPGGHRSDALAQKLDAKAEVLQQKKQQYGVQRKKDEKTPAGGFDDSPIPRAPPGFTVKFTFHRAHNLPFADFNTFSSDPYVMAELQTDLPTRHKQDPAMKWRTPTIRRCVEPVWNCEWIVANVPASGFALKARIYDEDPGDHDDRLGNAHIYVDRLNEDFPPIKEQSYSIKKRMGSKRAYFFRGCAAMFNRNVHMSGDLVMSVEVLGKTDTDNGGRLYTVGPCNWTQHLSPMIGRLAGTKEPGAEGKDGKQTESYKYVYSFPDLAPTLTIPSFQANQIQLAGPVPAALYHRYVEFRPFVKGMFTGKSLRGWILHRALHHQHNRIYNYSKDTIYGSFPSPSREMTLNFLDLVHYDKGGRIFTYVLTLDGQWRFTETGKEFGIDLLSKHTMHSDVNIYIAFSGEFFIRRLKTPRNSGSPEDQPTHPPAEIGGGPPGADPPKDPAYYTLIIDNDSGTYRPNAKCLPQLKEFMEKQLQGMKIVTLDCNGDKEKMDKWKSEQRERKKKEGKGVVMQQPGDTGSISSSDVEDLDATAAQAEGQQPKKKTKTEKAMAKVGGPIEKVKENTKGKEDRENRETQDDMTGTNGTAQPDGETTYDRSAHLNATGHKNDISVSNVEDDPKATVHQNDTFNSKMDPALTSQSRDAVHSPNPPHPSSAKTPDNPTVLQGNM